jgi:transcriptional regulator with XRE-family HTH domain
MLRMEKTFGQLLKEIRRSVGVSQRDLAAQVGVDFSYISKLENDRLSPPAADTTVRICEILEVVPDQLLALAGKLPTGASQMISSNPSAQQFMREAQMMGLSDAEWKQLSQGLKKLRGGDER